VYAGRSCRPLIGEGEDGGDIRGGMGTGEENELDGEAKRHFSAAKGERGCLTDVRLECVGVLRWSGIGLAPV
jgi:hypothetical protein